MVLVVGTGPCVGSGGYWSMVLVVGTGPWC